MNEMIIAVSDPQLREILGGPEYVGPVTAVKQEYEIFRTGRGDYVVFSRSNRSPSSFHMTFVAASKLDVLKRFVTKDGTTSRALMNESEVTEAFGTEDKGALYFEVLTTLYVMAALGMVDITKSGRNLLFTASEGA